MTTYEINRFLIQNFDAKPNDDKHLIESLRVIASAIYFVAYIYPSPVLMPLNRNWISEYATGKGFKEFGYAIVDKDELQGIIITAFY